MAVLSRQDAKECTTGWPAGWLTASVLVSRRELACSAGAIHLAQCPCCADAGEFAKAASSGEAAYSMHTKQSASAMLGCSEVT